MLGLKLIHVGKKDTERKEFNFLPSPQAPSNDEQTNGNETITLG